MNDDKPEYCDGCEFETPELTRFESQPYHNSRQKLEVNWFCSLCASTAVSRAVDYPTQFPHADVLKTICYVGNALIQEIRALSKK